MSYRGSRANLVTITAATEGSTSSTMYQRIGGFSLNIDEYSGKNLEVSFEALLETTDISHYAYLRIYDVTGGSVVGTDPLFSSRSLIPEKHSDTLSLGAGDRVYEVQLRMDSGASPDVVSCAAARLNLSWSDVGGGS